MREISEADWKLFRQLRQLALERFCERVLAEAMRLAGAEGESNHQRYLAVFQLLQRRDRELADAFNNPRRSTAFLQLARLRAEGLIMDEEFGRFSSETRTALQVFLGAE